MDVKQLNTFKIAAESLNFTHTAKMLNFAQSSVTSQIKALEAELGTLLFERLGKRLLLTEEGRKFKIYADRMVALASEAESALNGTAEPAGTITIGAQESQCTYRLPPVLSKFKSRFPNVRVVFQPANSDEETRSKLIDGIFDLALIMDVPRRGNPIKTESLIQENMKMVTWPHHALVGNTTTAPADLEHETLLLTQFGCSYRTILEEIFAAAGVHPLNTVEFVSIEAIKQCAISGLGIAVLPAMAVENELKKGNLAELAWKWSPKTIYTQLAWHQDKWISPPLKAFMDCTREVFEGQWCSAKDTI